MTVRHFLTGAALLTVSATTLGAQQIASTPSSSAAAMASGPTVNAARVAVHVSRHEEPLRPVALESSARLTRSETLMILGSAIFLTGAIIGDDPGTIIMIGGAAVGLYGLYLYLQQ